MTLKSRNKMFNKICLILFIINMANISVHSQNITCKNRYGKNFLEGVCQDVDTCMGAALIGNCANKDFICCIQDKSLNYPENSIITKKLFLKIAGDTSRNNYLYNFFSESMELARIDNQYKAAAYLSQLIGETDYFRSMESVKPENDFNNLIGNGAIGIGSDYRGRGAILLRGKLNYELANFKLNKTVGFDLISNPERAAFPSIAFKVGAWFWNENAYVIKTAQPAIKESLSVLADGTFLNFAHLTHALTNNLNSLTQRSYINDRIISELSITSIKRGQGVKCLIGDEEGYAV